MVNASQDVGIAQAGIETGRQSERNELAIAVAAAASALASYWRSLVAVETCCIVVAGIVAAWFADASSIALVVDCTVVAVMRSSPVEDSDIEGSDRVAANRWLGKKAAQTVAMAPADWHYSSAIARLDFLIH